MAWRHLGEAGGYHLRSCRVVDIGQDEGASGLVGFCLLHLLPPVVRVVASASAASMMASKMLPVCMAASNSGRVQLTALMPADLMVPISSALWSCSVR